MNAASQTERQHACHSSRKLALRQSRGWCDDMSNQDEMVKLRVDDAVLAAMAEVKAGSDRSSVERWRRAGPFVRARLREAARHRLHHLTAFGLPAPPPTTVSSTRTFAMSALFSAKERVMCYHGPLSYEAKVLEVRHPTHGHHSHWPAPAQFKRSDVL
jgi:hypothetical protein